MAYVFKNDRNEEGFCLNWGSNIGWGQMTFINNEGKLKVETECMSDNNDKKFIKLVLDKFIEKLDVIE
jgi:hypothetical protein